MVSTGASSTLAFDAYGRPQTGGSDVVITQYAPGKVHSPLMDGGDGWLYFFGYRGGGTKAEWGYVGDPLLRFNPSTGAAENLGPAIPDNSVACSQIDLSGEQQQQYIRIDHRGCLCGDKHRHQSLCKN